MSVLQGRAIPLILFVVAMASLAACYLVFWVGLLRVHKSLSTLLTLLVLSWFIVAMMFVAAAATREWSTRWLSIGMAGTVILMSSATTYFSLALAPLGIAIVAVSIVRIILKHRSAVSVSQMRLRLSDADMLPALVGVASILLGVAILVCAFIAAPNVLAVWTVIGLSAICAGIMLTLTVTTHEA